jgi:hypothetical protein
MTDSAWTIADLLAFLAERGPMSALTMAGTPVQAALEDKYIRQMHTLYGPVVLLTPEGEAVCGHPQPIRLTGPDAVTDRAYQNDARLVMEQAGYRVHAYRYKRHGQGSAVQGRRHSDAIVHSAR